MFTFLYHGYKPHFLEGTGSSNLRIKAKDTLYSKKRHFGVKFEDVNWNIFSTTC